MKRGRQVASVSLVVLFALCAYVSLQVSLSDAIGPGAGFFLFWLSVLGSILGGFRASVPRRTTACCRNRRRCWKRRFASVPLSFASSSS